jgi:hypothetical protein
MADDDPFAEIAQPLQGTDPGALPTMNTPAAPAQPKPRPRGATHRVRSKKDGKLHWTNHKGTVDYGATE